MSRTIFVTGTDTDVGKTYVSVLIVKKLIALGYNVSVMKPVASGCQWVDGQLKNDDALKLINACQSQAPYESVNPFALSEPIAPHIAAQAQRVDLCGLALTKFYNQCLDAQSDICLIEGAGGWLVPLNADECISDWVRALVCPVVLVVGMRLGCLNHALLTYQSICAGGVPVLGWVANCVDPAMPALAENIQCLRERLPCVCLGVVPYGSDDVNVLNVSMMVPGQAIV